MSEIRQDPTTKEWVIIATARGKRPFDFAQHVSRPETQSYINSCPLCPGNENMTPPAVLSFKGNNGSWQVRAFPNGYPAVTPDGGTSRRIEHQLFLTVDGMGSHEVIVETPIHNSQLALMKDSEVAEVLRAYKDRYDAAVQMPCVKSVLVFKNHGRAAGSSLEHPHSQVIATAVVPRHVEMAYDVAMAYYDEKGRSLYSDLMDSELEAGTRIVMNTEEFIVFHPSWIFGSRSTGATWLQRPRETNSTGRSLSIRFQQDKLPHPTGPELCRCPRWRSPNCYPATTGCSVACPLKTSPSIS